MHKYQKGLTLVEIIIMMSLVSMIGALSLFMSFETLRGYLYHTDRDLLIAALQHARAEAISNVCLNGGTISCLGAVAHGVHIDTHNGYVSDYVIFQGSYYQADDPVNAVIGASGALTLDTSDPISVSEVVFKASSGQVDTLSAHSNAIVLVDKVGRISTTTIGDEGEILWTH